MSYGFGGYDGFVILIGLGNDVNQNIRRRVGAEQLEPAQKVGLSGLLRIGLNLCAMKTTGGVFQILLNLENKGPGVGQTGENRTAAVVADDDDVRAAAVMLAPGFAP